MKHPFYMVDVFAEEKYAGNQLAVVRNASGLSGSQMQKIAAEMNYSETTFILSDLEQRGEYDVRIFSLDEELPFAGHPTLGTAFIIQQYLICREVEEVILNLKVGRIPVSFTYKAGYPEILWMKQVAPVFGRTFSAGELAAVLSIERESIDRSFPIEEVSTGLPFIIVPLKNLEAVKNCRINREAMMRLVEDAEAKSIFVFCPESYNPSNQVNARMFDHYHGIPEDPATGSANGCLAAYLVKNRYYGSARVSIRVEQGYEIGRPSLLLLKAEEEKGGAISVQVGGKVVMVAAGELL